MKNLSKISLNVCSKLQIHKDNSDKDDNRDDEVVKPLVSSFVIGRGLTNEDATVKVTKLLCRVLSIGAWMDFAAVVSSFLFYNSLSSGGRISSDIKRRTHYYDFPFCVVVTLHIETWRTSNVRPKLQNSSPRNGVHSNSEKSRVVIGSLGLREICEATKIFSCNEAPAVQTLAGT